MLHTDNLAAAAPRIISAQAVSSQEELLERALRPKALADYIGQHKAKEQLAIFIQAARQRGEALDHTLLFGPPGLGKTTLAHIIARELGVNLRQTSGPVLERAGDLAAAAMAAAVLAAAPGAGAAPGAVAAAASAAAALRGDGDASG